MDADDLICLLLNKKVKPNMVFEYLENKLLNKWTITDHFFNCYMDYAIMLKKYKNKNKKTNEDPDKIISLLLDYYPITLDHVNKYGSVIPFEYIIKNNIVLTQKLTDDYLSKYLYKDNPDFESINMMIAYTEINFNYQKILDSNLSGKYYEQIIKLLNTKNIKPTNNEILQCIKKVNYTDNIHKLCEYFCELNIIIDNKLLSSIKDPEIYYIFRKKQNLQLNP